MTEDEALADLDADAPYVRIQAAQWLAANASPRSSAALVAARSRESVPQVRRHLSEAIARARQDSTEQTGEVPPVGSERNDQLLLNLGALVSHETEPAIGWLRLAAEKEIEHFGQSDTQKAIQALRRRIDGVVAIARASKPPQFERLTLSSLIEVEIPHGADPQSLTLVVAMGDGGDGLDTDRALMSVILGNAIANALHAAQKAMPGGNEPIVVEAGVDETTFWLTITNVFAGSSFSMAEMGGIGTSTKTGGRGLGMVAMRTAADRLGYFLDVSGVGGIATTSLRGDRFNA